MGARRQLLTPDIQRERVATWLRRTQEQLIPVAEIGAESEALAHNLTFFRRCQDINGLLQPIECMKQHLNRHGVIVRGGTGDA
jgi:hypothetical protein